jgi:hypothetical protein
MAFSSVTRALGRLPLTSELLAKLDQKKALHLSGLARLPKGIVASTLAQAADRPLLVVTATLEEAGRWTAQLANRPFLPHIRVLTLRNLRPRIGNGMGPITSIGGCGAIG